ncbi:Homeobox-leucine zipper protein [Musa troglodytarum]|uniref:Homeobox-leucine zipper protein n=1 Tax=Musa troglodytarum TaxID=320322 RepID=A0A9E7L3T7_9LILI|nr:Homeobox-leucine zipper protein [Musa troglodytarum]
MKPQKSASATCWAAWEINLPSGHGQITTTFISLFDLVDISRPPSNARSMYVFQFASLTLLSACLVHYKFPCKIVPDVTSFALLHKKLSLGK